MPSSKYWRFKTIKKEERTKRWKVIFFWFFFTLAFLTIMWSFFFSPFFKITEIKLPENDVVTKNDIHKLMVSSAPLNLGENIFILSKNRVKSGLTAAFPAITNISIKKELFHGLIVNFEKRIQIGIWCNETNCYYFDKEGIVFKEAPQTEGALILKIEDFEKKEASLGDQVLNNDRLKFIAEFNNKITENNQFKIIEFKITPSANFDLEAITDRGWSIYLDQNQDPVSEANTLFTILNEVIKNKASNLEYIDLRLPSRVFYKMR
ncbi:MAG: cell division protein FtsQ/DivIB [bacterium]|nr:cell division protein FtsQ/DivIB [bacterium]